MESSKKNIYASHSAIRCETVLVSAGGFPIAHISSTSPAHASNSNSPKQISATHDLLRVLARSDDVMKDLHTWVHGRTATTDEAYSPTQNVDGRLCSSWMLHMVFKGVKQDLSSKRRSKHSTLLQLLEHPEPSMSTSSPYVRSYTLRLIFRVYKHRPQ